MFRKSFRRIPASVIKNVVQYPFEVGILTAVQLNAFPGGAVGDHFGNTIAHMQDSIAGVVCLFFVLG